MKKRRASTLLVAAGAVVMLGMLGLGSAVWLFTQSIQIDRAAPDDAEAALAAVRTQFAGVAPVIRLEDAEPTLARPIPQQSAGRAPSTLRVLHWDPDDGSLARVDLPFWLLRLKAGPIEVLSELGSPGGARTLNITVEELERFGPTLVVDHLGEAGDRLLVWTQ